MRPIDHNPSSRPRPFLLPAVAARRTCAAPLPRAGPVFDPNRKPAPRRLRFPQAEPPFFGLPASGGRTFDCASATTERRNGHGNLGVSHHRPHRQGRSEEHTSELQSLMRISYAVFCLKKKRKHTNKNKQTNN